MTLGTDDLVLCSGTLRHESFDVTAQAAAGAGFGGISLYHDEYADAIAEGWTSGEMRARLADLGLVLAELDGRSCWLPGDSSGPGIHEFIDVAADLGARSVTLHETQSRGRSGPPASLDAFVEAFARACDYAAGAELLVHLEYFPFSRVDDFATASEIARRAARANGGVTVDTWHHCRGRDAGRDNFGEKTTSVLALQISDIRSAPLADVAHEARHLRLLPGEGVGDIAGLIRALRAGGCTAPVGVEVYSDALSALGPFDAARWAYESAVRVVSAASTLDRGDGIAAPVAPGFEC